MRKIPGTKHISYHKRDKRYTVTVTINGKNRHLGSSTSLISALMIRDWCEANNWDVYPFKNRNKSSGEKYIHYRKNLDVYEIIKNINGQNEYFGRYHTLEEAIQWRDYFIKNDWNINQRLIGSTNKNIKYAKGKWRIYKVIDYHEYYFGSYNTLEEAEERLKEIRCKGWHNVLKDNERLINTTTSNIVKLANGKFEIVKNINGIRETFGVFKSYEDAEEEVRLLRKSNWDYDALCESHDETINGSHVWLTDGVKLKSTFTKLPYRNDGYAFSRGQKNEIKKELKKYGVI